jgi:hypothetical protein
LTWRSSFPYNATFDEVSFFDSAGMPPTGERAEDVALARDSKERLQGSSGSSQQEGPASAAQGAGIGWGLSAEDQEERFFLRRLAFSIAVAVVAVMGVWLLVTTPSQTGQSGPVLSALTEAPGGGPLAYTVVLRTVPGSQLDVIKQLIATDQIQQLAGGNSFQFLPSRDGSVAVCVGSFAERDSAEVAQLLGRFREVSTESGARPFAAAQVEPYRQ